MNAAAPLAGLTVLEVSSFIAAPLGGLTLAPRPAPVLGADTAAVLSGLLGLSAAEVRALTETNVVGGPTADQKGHECDA